MGSKSSELTLQEVYDILWGIVKREGRGSVEE
jgi:hypothetical protein